jgi:predicted PolB exonuclease-like 3'-5' exonuclease
MLKIVPQEVWAFDVEWVPDPESGRRVYGLPASLSDDEVRRHMWEKGGATEEDPQPYLKTVLCRVVSIASVIRRQGKDGSVSLKLHSLPVQDAPDATEADIIFRFLSALGKAKPQLVGYNSQSSDIIILMQRSLANSLCLPDFCRRPAKPWEGVDYFARGSDYNIDLKEEFGGWGKATPSLHELATVCRIPGKIGTDGQDVVDLWLKGDIGRIVQYNECDALTTYLVWLRAALMAGHLTADLFLREEAQLENMLREKAESPENEHLKHYLEVWQALRAG